MAKKEKKAKKAKQEKKHSAVDKTAKSGNGPKRKKSAKHHTSFDLANAQCSGCKKRCPLSKPKCSTGKKLRAALGNA